MKRAATSERSHVAPEGWHTVTPRIVVPDADATYRLALDAGARSVEEPFDTPYGDRRGMVEDRWGNTWQMATPLRRSPRR